jgi:hypothetical protein
MIDFVSNKKTALIAVFLGKILDSSITNVIDYFYEMRGVYPSRRA